MRSDTCDWLVIHIDLNPASAAQILIHNRADLLEIARRLSNSSLYYCCSADSNTPTLHQKRFDHLSNSPLFIHVFASPVCTGDLDDYLLRDLLS
jgi:hypothetical protein